MIIRIEVSNLFEAYLMCCFNSDLKIVLSDNKIYVQDDSEIYEELSIQERKKIVEDLLKELDFK